MEEAWSYASNGTNEMDQNELKVWIDLCIESAEIERKKVALHDLAKEFGFDEDDWWKKKFIKSNFDDGSSMCVYT